MLQRPESKPCVLVSCVRVSGVLVCWCATVGWIPGQEKTRLATGLIVNYLFYYSDNSTCADSTGAAHLAVVHLRYLAAHSSPVSIFSSTHLPKDERQSLQAFAFVETG